MRAAAGLLVLLLAVPASAGVRYSAQGPRAARAVQTALAPLSGVVQTEVARYLERQISPVQLHRNLTELNRRGLLDARRAGSANGMTQAIIQGGVMWKNRQDMADTLSVIEMALRAQGMRGAEMDGLSAAAAEARRRSGAALDRFEAIARQFGVAVDGGPRPTAVTFVDAGAAPAPRLSGLRAYSPQSGPAARPASAADRRRLKEDLKKDGARLASAGLNFFAPAVGAFVALVGALLIFLRTLWRVLAAGPPPARGLARQDV